MPTTMRKSVVERIKVTKTGKLIRRTMGLGHFRAKKNSRQLHRKHNQSVSPIDVRMFNKKYL